MNKCEHWSFKLHDAAPETICSCFKLDTCWIWLVSSEIEPVDSTCTKLTIFIPTIKNPIDPQGLFVFQTFRSPWVKAHAVPMTCIQSTSTSHEHTVLSHMQTSLRVVRQYPCIWSHASFLNDIHESTLPPHHHSRMSTVTENPETPGCWLSAWPLWLWCDDPKLSLQ